eukprot:scaffold1649_cov134-Isochrysis_galbana.AAC.12
MGQAGRRRHSPSAPRRAPATARRASPASQSVGQGGRRSWRGRTETRPARRRHTRRAAAAACRQACGQPLARAAALQHQAQADRCWLGPTGHQASSGRRRQAARRPARQQRRSCWQALQRARALDTSRPRIGTPRAAGTRPPPTRRPLLAERQKAGRPAFAWQGGFRRRQSGACRGRPVRRCGTHLPVGNGAPRLPRLPLPLLPRHRRRLQIHPASESRPSDCAAGSSRRAVCGRAALQPRASPRAGAGLPQQSWPPVVDCRRRRARG